MMTVWCMVTSGLCHLPFAKEQSALAGRAMQNRPLSCLKNHARVVVMFKELQNDRSQIVCFWPVRRHGFI